jgi:uncharacterized protein (TIGR00730 family)
MASICVFCSSSERIDPAHVELAGAFGAELARRGHRLVSGGGRVSMMGAVARAARAGGAHTVGVIPQALVGWEVADEEADELLVTADMRSRKAAMDDRADAFVTLPGGIGTLEELLEIWVARSLGLHAKPVIVLDPEGVYADLHKCVESLQDRGFVRPEAIRLLTWTRTVAEALDAVEAQLDPGRAASSAGSRAEANNDATDLLEMDIEPPPWPHGTIGP